jgi:hypothetical protein
MDCTTACSAQTTRADRSYRTGRPSFDWINCSTWFAVSQGATTAYRTSQADLTLTGATEAVGSFAALATENGIWYLVLLPGCREEALKPSDVDEIILHASWFD